LKRWSANKLTIKQFDSASSSYLFTRSLNLYTQRVLIS